MAEEVKTGSFFGLKDVEVVPSKEMVADALARLGEIDDFVEKKGWINKPDRVLFIFRELLAASQATKV